jgi:predicted nucleotidyltransferase
MLQNCSIMKVAEIFFTEPTARHYLIEISKKSKLAHTSVKTHLNNLNNQGIITQNKEKKGKRNFPYFFANIQNNKYKFYKRIFNNLSIDNSGLTEFIRDQLSPRSIVVFGSYALGEDIEGSDIDIFIESKKHSLNLETFEKKLKRKIELHFNDNFNSYSSELKNNIINGNILYGYLEVFK